MQTIVLLSCVKSKLSVPAPAQDLYTSPLFKFSLAYARQLAPDAIYVLSAKYGLVALDQQIAPYEQTLKKMSAAERAHWGERVLHQLAAVCNPATDHFTILAGTAYSDPLLRQLPHHSLPLAGLGQGMRLQFLKRALSEGKIQPIRSSPQQAAKQPPPSSPPARTLWQRFRDAF